MIFVGFVPEQWNSLRQRVSITECAGFVLEDLSSNYMYGTIGVPALAENANGYESGNHCN